MPALGLWAGSLAVSTEGSALVSGICRLGCTFVQVQADMDNKAIVWLGTAAAQPWQLTAGQTVQLYVSALSIVIVKTIRGSATVNWLADNRRV